MARQMWHVSLQSWGTRVSGGGYRRFVFINKSEGNVVAAAGRDAALQENQGELEEAIENMTAKQSELLAAMERRLVLKAPRKKSRAKLPRRS